MNEWTAHRETKWTIEIRDTQTPITPTSTFDWISIRSSRCVISFYFPFLANDVFCVGFFFVRHQNFVHPNFRLHFSLLSVSFFVLFSLVRFPVVVCGILILPSKKFLINTCNIYKLINFLMSCLAWYMPEKRLFCCVFSFFVFLFFSRILLFFFVSLWGLYRSSCFVLFVWLWLLSSPHRHQKDTQREANRRQKEIEEKERNEKNVNTKSSSCADLRSYQKNKTKRIPQE